MRAPVTLAARAQLLLLLTMSLPATAIPVKYEFSWTGDAGYSARGAFVYDNSTAPAVISEAGDGPLQVLDYLTVSFFDPSNNLMESYDTVLGGVSQSPFFRFNFDTATGELTGGFNAGGGTGVLGEQFFTRGLSTPDSPDLARLRQIDTPNPDILLDSQQTGILTVVPALTYSFSWTGDAGYSARGTFAYDVHAAPAVISEAGLGPMQRLEFLNVAFFDPSGNLMESYDTVLGGVSQSPFFRFSFDTATEQLIGGFNAGGGTGVPGEQFFTRGLSISPFPDLARLRQIDTPNADILLDSQNPGILTVTRSQPVSVPEPGSLALIFIALSMLAAAAFRRTSRTALHCAPAVPC